ncbi:unnamed protein product [Lactuca saligna]|uniref:MULE transposase domain-containing protein n=1 Tax=Lactuca saligna TaxID=75948 RepID=A0AA36E643_LACSI|nr:unnamed protein product [Lactuca saligna]
MGEKEGVCEFFEEDMGENEDVYPKLPNIFNDKLNWKEQEPDLGMRRAKKHALTLVEGTIPENYARLWSYGEEIRRSNPGSTVKICVDLMADRELLCAVDRDANNGIFSIAWAVVSVENKEKWKWFLETLSEDLQCWNDGNGLVLISDQHKVMVDATDALDRPGDEEQMVGVNGRDEGMNVNARVKHVKPPKMRKKSERIIKMKLAKNIGSKGSSVATATELD